MINHNINRLIEFLHQDLDVNFIEPQLDKDSAKIKALINHSRDPLIRCLVRPMGEMYAPVYWDSDLTVKLTYKKGWGGYYVFLTTYNLAIFDLDMSLPPTEQQYPKHMAFFEKILTVAGLEKELFYVHATPRGYHLYLVSRSLDYCSQGSFEMGQKLSSDPAHLRNSLYYGYSVRATLKEGDTFVSKRIGSVGSGSEDPELVIIYHKLVGLQSLFETETHHTILSSEYLIPLVHRAIRNGGRFGNLHMTKVCPLWLEESSSEDVATGVDVATSGKANKVQIVNLTNNECESSGTIWKRVCKYRYFRESEFLETAKVMSQKIRNMIQYHIIKSNQDYAIGYDLGHSLVFISYSQLLCVDYDEKSRLKIVYEFVRYHPEYLFKVVKTNNGYHVFLVSHLLDHNQWETVQLLSRLCSDPIHILNAYNRGFSIRINQKADEKYPYREVATIGKGLANSKALKLYQLHFQLYDKYRTKFRCKEVETMIDTKLHLHSN